MGDYERGFTDALELVVSELEDAKDLKDAKERVKLLLSLALEHKMTELKTQTGLRGHQAWLRHEISTCSPRQRHMNSLMRV